MNEPIPSPPPPVANPTGVLAKKLAQEAFALLKLFATRILKSNFTEEKPSEAESKALLGAKVPITSPIAQNYTVWRRAVLWLAVSGLCIAAIGTAIESIPQMFNEEQVPAISVVMFLLTGLLIAAAILTVRAALYWTEVERSRKLARWGWLCMFLGPFLVFLLPIRLLVEDETRGIDAQGALGVAAMFGIAAAATLIPRVFGLFPGLLRACLTLRSLMPVSPLPGYIAALLAPLYVLLCLIALIVAEHVGSLLFFLGILGVIGSPIVLLFNVKKLATPMDAASAATHLKAMRIKMGALTGFGLLCLLISSSSIMKDVTLWQIIRFAWELLGNIFLLTVVMSDFLLGLIKHASEQETALRSSPLFPELRNRFDELDAAGLAGDTPSSTVPPVP